jgi:hypothetical protein
VDRAGEGELITQVRLRYRLDVYCGKGQASGLEVNDAEPKVDVAFSTPKMLSVV